MNIPIVHESTSELMNLLFTEPHMSMLPDKHMHKYKNHTRFPSLRLQEF